MAVRPIAGDHLDFLDLLTPEARKRLLTGAPRAKFAAGAILYRPGDGERMLIVESGLIRVYFQDPEGRQATVLLAGDHSLVGATNVMGHVPELFAQAVLDTSTINPSPQAFRRLVTEDLATAVAVANYLAWRLRKTFLLVSLRSLGSMRERLAYDLLERAGQARGSGGQLEIKASHASLADSVGTSREVASRTLATFDAEGIVETSRGIVRILDLPRLVSVVRDYVI